MSKIKILIALSILIIVSSCKDKEDPPLVEYKKNSGVFICNEGNFTFGNASLSFYDPETKEVSNDIFYNGNNFPLGDVAQSMTIDGKTGYIVINNSGKVLVINTDDFTHKGTISGLTSPRYIEIIDNSKAYVTDLYNENIAIVNPTTFEKIGDLNIGHGTEQMVSHGDFTYVTSWSYNDKVYKINHITDQIIDTITVTKQPNSIVVDKNNKLWVLSDGGAQGSTYGQVNSALTCINIDNFSIEQAFTFPSIETSPSELTTNGNKDTLYFLNGSWGSSVAESGVYRMSIDEQLLPSTPFINEGNNMFYGLGVDPEKTSIYVSDAIDYSQKGIVYRYSGSGTVVDSFKVEISPSAFCFKE